jgi:membrane protein YqaA with SNARE-associated domain/membrane-associated phospholipid phosphatase
LKEFLNQFVNMVQFYGVTGLIAISFAESSFFPIPPDVLLIPMCFINRKLALVYALITTISSVLGGIFGHLIGRKLGKPILNKFFSKDKINKVEKYFDTYGGWAVAIAGFTPIPYKIFTISAGAFGVKMPVFVVSSFLGRAGRFFLEGLIIFFLGDAAKYYLNNYFEIITVVLTVVLILAYFLWAKLKQMKKVSGTGAAAYFNKKYKSLYSYISKYRVYDQAAFYLFSGIVLSILSLFLFLGLVEDYYEFGSFGFDKKIFSFVQSIRSEDLNKAFETITITGNTISVIVLTLSVVFLLYYFKKKKESLFFGLNILGVWIFNEILKIIFKRPRPLEMRLIDATGYSFPSGHSMIFMTFSLTVIYFMITYFSKKKIVYILSILLLILAIAVGLSRVYLGVHYFSDVIGGWLAGTLWSSTSVIIYRTFFIRNKI